MKKIKILGVLVENNSASANQVQEILTTFGCLIRTRIGLHNDFDSTNPNLGLIILELAGSKEDMKSLKRKLKKIDGVKIKSMKFK